MHEILYSQKNFWAVRIRKRTLESKIKFIFTCYTFRPKAKIRWKNQRVTILSVEMKPKSTGVFQLKPLFLLYYQHYANVWLTRSLTTGHYIIQFWSHSGHSKIKQFVSCVKCSNIRLIIYKAASLVSIGNCKWCLILWSSFIHSLVHSFIRTVNKCFIALFAYTIKFSSV